MLEGTEKKCVEVVSVNVSLQEWIEDSNIRSTVSSKKDKKQRNSILGTPQFSLRKEVRERKKKTHKKNKRIDKSPSKDQGLAAKGTKWYLIGYV